MYIKGNFKKTIFSTNEGYTVGLFRVKESDIDELIDKTITFTGYFHELNEVDTYEFTGKLVEHKKYGKQFNVEKYTKVLPDSIDSTIDFLTSGLFKGIGKKKAKLLVDKYKDKTLDIILNSPEDLILIPTITKKNIDVLHNTLQEYSASYEIVIYLNELGFNINDSTIIYNFYKENTKKIIEEDIYRLIIDIKNMTYKKIDYIALSMGIEKNSLIRLRGSILYIMEEISNRLGHTYYLADEIYSHLTNLLKIDISEEEFHNSLESLIDDFLIIEKNNLYYLYELYSSEDLISRRLKLLSHTTNKRKNIDTIIETVESNLNIKYNNEQINAIKKSINNSVLIITGGPGSGKTTIIKGIIETYKEINKLSYSNLLDEVALLAPTGRATKRMSEVSSYPASTIHSFLKWQKESNKFLVNEYHKSKAKLLIIDETSMIDVSLMASLLKGVSVHTKIILIGDDHQLPSVGPGDMLHNLIDSEVIDVIELKNIYRQSSKSKIIDLAYNIRNMNIDESIFNNSPDLSFINCSEKDIINHIKELAITYKDLSYKDFQILIPMYKGINGIDNINNKIQELYNPKTNNNEIVIGETIFRENDKVICLTNQIDEDIYNGDIGIIEEVNNIKKELLIDFDGIKCRITKSNFKDIKLAYAISIHKAQGSEFNTVVIPICRAYSKMLYQKLIYTAVTRAKQNLFLIGSFDSLVYATNNNISSLRKSSLKEIIQK